MVINFSQLVKVERVLVIKEIIFPVSRGIDIHFRSLEWGGIGYILNCSRNKTD